METSISTQTAPQPAARRSRVSFSGQAGEYFGIWIVNVLLTIVTLGIYSAWAKVRNKQYFYGHTKVDGHNFRYLATPIQILKGRLLAVAVFIAISFVTTVVPFLAVLFSFALLFILPWLMVQGIRFNLRMTSYRNVRFGFHGSYGDAFIYFLLLPFVSVFTLYLAMPWAIKKLDQFVYQNISYGGKQLQVQTETSAYYKATLGAVIVAISLLLVGVGVIAAVGPLFNTAEPSPLLMAPVFFGYFVILTLAGAVYKALIRNHLFNNTTLPELVSFKSDLPVLTLFAVQLSNMLAIICTLGLALPWAMVRMSRLLAEYTEVTVQPGLEPMRDKLAKESSAFAEDAADLYDADFSLT
ncbi:YjgN family protein [Rheinheimera sp.]|uniref:YjgN family protein n=1 Tax=Rheinheimera sp. TaxID=1869214 RepID=UPI002FDD43D6